MKKTRHTTKEIIAKLRQTDVVLGKGQKVPEVCKALEITEQTYYRWRQKYSGMATAMAMAAFFTAVSASALAMLASATRTPASSWITLLLAACNWAFT
jgi:putative transposase